MSGRYAKGDQKILEGGIIWMTADMKAVLLSAAYTVNLASHEFLADLAGAVVATSPSLYEKSATLGVADCHDITFGAVTGATCTQMAVFKDTGVAATSPLLLHVSSAVGLPAYPNGGDVVVVVDAAGLFKM